MSRPSITLRDLFTVGALVISVAALANNTPFGAGVGRVDASPWDGSAEAQRERVDRERLRDRRFGRLEAREFFLIDDDGRERASLIVDSGNVLRFKAGSERTSDSFLLSVFPDGRTALLMKDARGRNRATMAIAEDGRPFMSLDERGAFCLDDERGQHQLVLRVHDDGQPELWFAGKTVLPKGRRAD